MPVYAYKGVDGKGRTVSGAKDADSPKSLRAALRRDGVLVTDVAEAKAGKRAKVAGGKGLSHEVDFGAWFERVKRAEVTAFTRQLATLLKAGIPLAEALGALFEQVDNAKLETIVGDVRTRVNEGSSLADSLARHPKSFEEIYISMVRAGEAAGNLDEILTRLADFMEGQVRLRSKVVGAMVYPIIMTIIGTAILGILMVSVVPQIVDMFADQEAALPWNTQLLIFVSAVMSDYWYLWIFLAPLGIFGTVRWVRSPKGRPVFDRVLLRMPVVGPLVRQIAIARFARTLGTMLQSGVALLRALEISKSILGNAVLTKVIENAREQIQQGDSIANTLKRSGEFPSVVTHMIAVGERAGQLEQMLANVATAFESEVEMKLGRLTTILEPMMIVLMGGAVAFVVFSVLMPIMQMNTFVQ